MQNLGKSGKNSEGALRISLRIYLCVNYMGLLNNMSLNCTGLLICGCLSIVDTIVYTNARWEGSQMQNCRYKRTTHREGQL